FHCGLLRTPLGLCAIDLLGREGISVNGTPVRWTRLDEGDELQVGELLLRVRYHPVSGLCATPAPAPECGSLPLAATASSALVPGADEREERDRLRDEQATAAAEGLRGQVTALERALAEAGAAAERVRAEERRSGQEPLDDARRQADQKCQAAHAEAEALRQEVEALRQEFERALANDLTRASQEARAQCEAEARAAEERVRAEERCHWQEQLDDACRQADQKCQAGQAEAEALRQEVEAVRQEREQAEKLRGQVAAL